MRLFLLRHGRTQWNKEGIFRGRADIPLDEVGRKEAELLGKRLKDVPIKAIFSSPLKRAQETASIIASFTKSPVFVREELIDISFGSWEGLSVEEVRLRFPDLYEKWLNAPHELSFPQGESLKVVEERAFNFIEDLKSNHQKDTIALVTHRVVLKVLISKLLGLNLKAFWRIEQGTSALNEFEWKNGMWVIKTINDTCHTRELKEAALEF